MHINIILSKEQKLPQNYIEAFENELNCKIKSAFPSSRITVKRGFKAGFEIQGFPSDSDRERLAVILQETWEDVCCH